MSTTQNESFSIMNKIPLQLRLWWDDLGKEGHDEIKKHLKGLTSLLDIRPRGDIIRALVPHWTLRTMFSTSRTLNLPQL